MTAFSLVAGVLFLSVFFCPSHVFVFCSSWGSQHFLRLSLLCCWYGGGVLEACVMLYTDVASVFLCVSPCFVVDMVMVFWRLVSCYILMLPVFFCASLLALLLIWWWCFGGLCHVIYWCCQCFFVRLSLLCCWYGDGVFGGLCHIIYWCCHRELLLFIMIRQVWAAEGSCICAETASHHLYTVNRARKSRVCFAWRYEIHGMIASFGTVRAQPRFRSHVKSMGVFSLLQLIAI